METHRSISEPLNAPTDRPVAHAKRVGPKLVLGLASLVLLLAALLILVPQVLLRPEAPKRDPYSAVMLNPPRGWIATEVPLASSPDGKLQVAKTLQFDDALAVRYTNDSGIAVDVYAAYWSPGKAPYTLVGEHTPDSCWIHSGWQCVARTHDFQFNGPELKLKTGEVGTYTFEEHPTHVIFWHLVNGEPHASLELNGWVRGMRGYLQRLPLFFRDLRRYSLNLAQDQSFVRVSSTVPVDQLLARPDVQELLGALKPLGILAVADAPAR